MNPNGVSFKTVAWLAGIFFGLMAALWGGQKLTPVPNPPSANPVAALIQVAAGQAQLPLASIILAVIVVVLVLGLAMFLPSSSATSKKWEMARGHLLRGGPGEGPLMAASRAQEAALLHPQAPATMAPGIPVGASLKTGQPLYQGWRQCGLQITAPGRGKTTAQVIPHALMAPGSYVMTGVKPDGVLEVLEGRARMNGRTWVFDASQIITTSGKPSFTLDLLKSIRTFEDAEEMAKVLESARKNHQDHGANEDWGIQSVNLCAALLLAAAKGGEPIRVVYDWIAKREFFHATDILHEHGLDRGVLVLEGLDKLHDRTLAGVIFGATRIMTPLALDHLIAWTDPRKGVPVFDPDEFVESGKDTLVVLAKAKGSGGAFGSALLKVVFESAQRAARKNGGRLPVPLMADLDEVGNLVNLPELPAWYSYFGSMGICVTAYLQSWAQGEGIWGKAGMEALNEEANMRVYGGGLEDPEYLGRLSKISGHKEVAKHSSSYSHKGGRSSSTSFERREVLTVADLAGMPRGLLMLRSSDGVSTIARATPWFENEAMRQALPAAVKRAQQACGESKGK